MKYKTQKEGIIIPKIKLRKVKGQYPQQEEVIMTSLDHDRKKPRVKSKKRTSKIKKKTDTVLFKCSGFHEVSFQ